MINRIIVLTLVSVLLIGCFQGTYNPDGSYNPSPIEEVFTFLQKPAKVAGDLGVPYAGLIASIFGLGAGGVAEYNRRKHKKVATDKRTKLEKLVFAIEGLKEEISPEEKTKILGLLAKHSPESLRDEVREIRKVLG